MPIFGPVKRADLFATCVKRDSMVRTLAVSTST